MAEKQASTTDGNCDPRLARTILAALESGKLCQRIDEEGQARGIVVEPLGHECRELAVQVIVEDLDQPVEEVRAILDPMFKQFIAIHQTRLTLSDRERKAFDLGREQQAQLSHVAWKVSQ